MSILVQGERFMIAPTSYLCMFGKVVWADRGEAVMHFSDGSSSSDFSESHEDWLRIGKDEKIVYIAGPMRGREYYNADSFGFAYKCLLNAGYDYIINPVAADLDAGFDHYDMPEFHDWNELPLGFSLELAASRCMHSVAICDSIVLLPGWRDSVGAMAEYHTALWLKKEVLTISFFEKENGEVGYSLEKLGEDTSDSGKGDSLARALSDYSLRFLRSLSGRKDGK
jgi:hypothetical protein